MNNKGAIIINYTGRRGGGNLDAFEMAKALQEKGEQVFPLLSSGIENLSMWEEAGFEKLIVMDTYSGKVSFVINTLLFGLKTKSAILKQLGDVPVKAVYCPMSTMWSDRINALFPKAKIIMTIHDPEVHSGTSIWIRLLDQKKMVYDAIVVHSKVFVEQVKQMRNSSEPVYYIPLGRHNLYRNIKEKKTMISYNPKLINFVFFGRIEEYKGLDVLEKAWETIDEKYHDKVSLSIVGNGDFSPYTESYKKYTNVTVINRWIEDGEVESVFLGENLICVCPYKDGTQSGVILTAMDYGVPTIASDTGGIGEQIMDGETGLLVQPCDVDELVSAMERFVLEENLLESMKPKMQEFLKEMTWEHSAEMLLEITNKSE